MIHPPLRSHRGLRHLAIGASLLVLAFLTGCAHRGGTVQLDADGKTEEESLAHSFNQAYITGRAGEYDIVLVDSAAEWDYRKGKRNKPLQSTQLAPVRHIMRIHLYWRPLAGTTRNPAAINASIDWYVLGPDGSDSKMVYEGAGYVSLRGSRGSRTVIIKDGRIKPKSHQGELGDPIGPAQITGRATAIVDETRVREIISEINRETGVVQP
ncbi:MAG TPA: hypothetical protein VHP11_17045 [Tepidisphaeraceae bacterium]|nr:hypothetical protein [Tepidisphaeraceae bacterium]